MIEKKRVSRLRFRPSSLETHQSALVASYFFLTWFAIAIFSIFCQWFLSESVVWIDWRVLVQICTGSALVNVTLFHFLVQHRQVHLLELIFDSGLISIVVIVVSLLMWAIPNLRNTQLFTVFTATGAASIIISCVLLLAVVTGQNSLQ